MVIQQAENNISENDAILYDRQIRLWGLEAQKRLRKTAMLVVGCQALAGETVKNIVLAGIARLVLCDSETATEADVKSNFLIPVTSVGVNRAEACLERTMRLNPTVAVTADKRSIDKIDEKYLSQFSVVLMTNIDLPNLIRVNEICRKLNIKFYCGHVWGTLGYYFVDLKDHNYVQEIKRLPAKPKKAEILSINNENDVKAENEDSDIECLEDDITEENSKKQATSTNKAEDSDDDLTMIVDNDKNGKTEIEDDTPKFTKHVEYFPSLKQALKVNFSAPKYQKMIQRKRFDPAFFAVLCLLRFRSVFKRNPQKSSHEKDVAALMQMRKEVMELYKMELEYLPEQLLFDVCDELSPVCAVVGGVLAQEIILAVSGTEPPHKNFFLYNPMSLGGRVHDIGEVTQNSTNGKAYKA